MIMQVCTDLKRAVRKKILSLPSHASLFSFFSQSPFILSYRLFFTMAPNSRIILCRHSQAEHNVDLDYSSTY